MLQVLIAQLVAGALVAWITAAGSALGIVRLAAPGERLRSYFDLGFWRFQRLTERLGAAVVPLIASYRLSFFVFFAFALLLIAVLSLLAIAQME